VLFLYRPDGTTLRLVELNNRCVDSDERQSCIVVAFSAEDVTAYSGQTWYLRVKEYEGLFGDGVDYNLHINLVSSGAEATATPTRTPSATETPEAIDPTPESGEATVTVTSTSTVTPEPVNERVTASQGAKIRTTNGDTDIDLPANFTSASEDVSFGLTGGKGAGRMLFEGQTLRSVRTLNARASDAATGDRLTDFDLAVGICSTFTYADMKSVKQGELRIFWVDPATGERRHDGITVTKLRAATGPGDVPKNQPGEICFKTTHLTEFEPAAGEVPTPTPRPTRTATRVVVVQESVTATVSPVASPKLYLPAALKAATSGW
jgi:hypothetical protein